MSCESLWLGALTSTSITAAARMSLSSASVRLVATAGQTVLRGDPAATVGNITKLTIAGLTPDTSYVATVEADGNAAAGISGAFKTAPTSGGFTVAFGGDVSEKSNHVVFDTIRNLAPLMFIHLGDAHYNNVIVNSQANYRAVFDELAANPRQALLYRTIPTAYVWDDHDFSDNNSDSTAVNKSASAAVYRARVPHYALPDATGVWQTFDIGRIRFVLTDQRSAASVNSATDNASKSMLGAAQKTWFKGLLSASPGKLIVWFCPRAFGGVATAGADHWGGFTAERLELADHIHANCAGRVVVLSADAHALAIDDGSHHAYAAGGLEPLRTFQAAPLDRTPDSVIYGSAQYSAGWFNANGQFGTMQIVDAGGSTIDVTWRGYDSAGSVLVTSSFTVTVQ